MRKYKDFEKYFTEREDQDVGPDPMPSGTFQKDPDKENRDSDLLAALKEIVELARKAISVREKGLGDAGTHNNPLDKEEDASMNKLVARPTADGAGSMFGGDGAQG